MRICTTNESLLQELKSSLPDVDCAFVKPSALKEQLDKADIFILDDASLRALGTVRDSTVHATFVAYCSEKEALPPSYVAGIADDLLLLPLRELDLGRIIRMHELLQALRNAEESSQAIPKLVKQLTEDITLAEKIQRRLIRDKFPPIGGLAIKSKYLCGLKSGGDYFDVFEFPDGLHVGFIMTDCSSYSLSSSLLGALMQFSMNFGPDELDNPSLIVKSLLTKLRDGMKEKDRLSIFYGILNRKTYRVRYVDCGSIFALQKRISGELRWGAKGDRAPLTKDKGEVPDTLELMLEPGDRLLLASDGWSDAVGEPQAKLLEAMLGKDWEAHELINELAFRLRKNVTKEQGDADDDGDLPMPPQDCSILLLELGKNVLRLAQ
ncbi:MAG: PP2C family protein-serine/threonine phosphatase [Bdellovibrionota bacterium]